MESAALNLDAMELPDALEGVVGRADGVEKGALILDFAADGVVEPNDGVVEWVETVRAISE